MSDDFCVIHGYDHMRSRLGDSIPYCEVCEEISLLKSQLANCHKEIFRLRDELLRKIGPMGANQT